MFSGQLELNDFNIVGLSDESTLSHYITLNEDDYVLWSHCFGTLNWGDLLIPTKDIRQHNEEIYEDMLERDIENDIKNKEEQEHMEEHIQDIDDELNE